MGKDHRYNGSNGKRNESQLITNDTEKPSNKHPLEYSRRGGGEGRKVNRGKGGGKSFASTTKGGRKKREREGEGKRDRMRGGVGKSREDNGF